MSYMDIGSCQRKSIEKQRHHRDRLKINATRYAEQLGETYVSPSYSGYIYYSLIHRRHL